MTEIDLQMMAVGLADKLAVLLPAATIFVNPSQQIMTDALDNGASLPCFFILLRPQSSIKPDAGGRFLWRPLFELVYLEELYSPTTQTGYMKAAQLLDEKMEAFMAGSTLVRTYNRKWTIELQALHYLLDIKQFVRLPKPEVPRMETLILNQRLIGDQTDVMTSGIIKINTGGQ